MLVSVKVRSASFEIECGSAGTNRVLWLAVQAKQRYARLYDLDPDSIIPIDVCNQAGTPAWPHDLIVDRIKPGDVVSVSIRDSESSLSEPTAPTLWERMAVIEPKDYLPVLFAIDLRRFDDPGAFDDIENSFRQKEQDDEDMIDMDHKLEEPVGHHAISKPKAPATIQPKPQTVSVCGNFTNWRLPVVMVESDTPNLYSIQLRMPPGAVLLFRFNVDDKLMVSEAHQIMMDSKGLQLNVINVPFDRKHKADDACRHFKLISNPSLDLTKLGDQALSEYAKAQLQRSADRRRCFNEDWSQIHSKELVNTAETYRALKDAVWSQYKFVTAVFQAFSTPQNNGLRDYMSNMQFWLLCQKCQLSSMKMSLHQITEIAANSITAADRVAKNPTHPDNHFTRPQFLESVIRLAKAVYPQISPADAFTTFVAYYLMPHALKPMEPNAFRARICEVTVQQTFFQFQQQVLELFETYCNRNDNCAERKFVMGFPEFRRMLNEYGIKTDGRASKQTGMLFTCSQDESDVEENPGHQIVFEEFLEALAKLADIRYREKVPLDCKVSRLFVEVFFRKATRQVTSS